MKLYKKILSAFGGAGLYLDKSILKALKVVPGDEIVIDVQDNKVTLTKSIIDADKIKELLDAAKKSEERIRP